MDTVVPQCNEQRIDNYHTININKYLKNQPTWHTFLLTQVNKLNLIMILISLHSLLFFKFLLSFLMSDVFPFTSRWGSSVQHSHREHLGCRKTRGGVFQDEKCKDSTSQPLWNLLSFWVFGPKLLQVQYIDCSLTSCPFFPSSRCSRLFNQSEPSTSRPTTVLRRATGSTSWPKSASATANA